jgi:hypothetical protein
MDEELTRTLTEHRRIIDTHDGDIYASKQVLTKHDEVLKALSESVDVCHVERRKHERSYQEVQANQQILLTSIQNMQEMHRADIQEMRDAHKVMCRNIEEQTKHTKIIADVLTTGATLKKVLGGLAFVVVSLGTILGGVAFGISWLLTVPLPS